MEVLINFQSTLPVGGATPYVQATPFRSNISIHAPRGGSDCSCAFNSKNDLYFNPRSPWGERPPLPICCGAPILFQSTLPVGGATIYIQRRQAGTLHFNPRSPWGERQQRCTDFSVNLWQKCIFSECFLRKSPGYSGWIFGKPLFLPQKFLRTSREFLGALASHGGRLTISQRISVSSGR